MVNTDEIDVHLSEFDERLLRFLEEGRCTPILVKRLLEREGDEYSRQHINNRLRRLEEHGIVENLHDTGVYQLLEPEGESGTEFAPPVFVRKTT